MDLCLQEDMQMPAVDLATGGGSVVAGLASTEDGGYRHRQSNTHSQWVVPSLPGYAASQP